MNNCPCKNCLLFPICKAQVNDYIKANPYNVSEDVIYIMYDIILKPKCSLIEKYIDESPILISLVHERFLFLYNIFMLNSSIILYK